MRECNKYLFGKLRDQRQNNLKSDLTEIICGRVPRNKQARYRYNCIFCDAELSVTFQNKYQLALAEDWTGLLV